ncbi:isochorismatase [Pontibacillus halophilus JSM 076056 = DSM 19796]|uniref:Isochorismatase n=1 Tax=Pontibacillus halophilus JSM 076056 = DSM 19796 TaxID=1385510 RepID=A0A0A5ICS4_9BACI|nr:isochorismatase family cysteine hydrolase [Pontibacillus halophilus]KGX93647.1 isochorismatase [Pontibacillus halophilus JSM 076056 = DSM 19796]
MKLRPQDTAFVLVDLINDFKFSHGEVLLRHTELIVPNILKLKTFAAKNSIPIIYVNDHYQLWKADLQSILAKCQTEQNKEYLQQIQPNESDYFLIKPKHSAFHQTALQALLAELQVRQVILSGVAGNICVLFTANDAYMRDYELFIPHDAIASVDEQDNAYALRMMHNVLKADTSPTEKYE